MGVKRFRLRARSKSMARGLGPAKDYIVLIDEDDAHLMRSYPWHVKRVKERRGKGAAGTFIVYPFGCVMGKNQSLGRAVIGDARLTEGERVRYRDGNAFNCTRANLYTEVQGWNIDALDDDDGTETETEQESEKV
jgi:hypothetical protein